MSGGTTGTPKGVLGTHGVYVVPALQEKAWIGSVLDGDRDVILLPLPLFHVYANVGVQGLGARQRQPDRAGAESAGPRRSPGHDPAGETGVLQRRADAVYRPAESPRRAEGQGRFQVDQDLLFRVRRRCSPTPSSGSNRSPAAASSKGIR